MKQAIFWTSAKVSIFAAIFVTAAANFAMFEKLFAWRVESGTNLYPVLSVVILQALLLVFFFTFVSGHKAFRYILSLFLLVAAISSYFEDTYGVVIDRGMILNALETNSAEVADLLSWHILFYLSFIFIIPTIFLFKIKVREQSHIRRLGNHFAVSLSALVMMAAIIFLYSDFYASFFREHKAITDYSNPLATIDAFIKVARQDIFKPEPDKLEKIGLDAKIADSDVDRELVIMVVGETARADRFSLNGYARKTNPLLEQQSLVSFSNFDACGTSTAHSVPCMFSIKNQQNFSKSDAKYQENALDILKRGGVNIIWRDNNSSSKGVADRIQFQNFRSQELNPLCDPECRDVGMLSGLDEYIQSHVDGDILIVLHQMGSHGPAYYKRYPETYAVFGKGCETNQLDQCTAEQINNSYDSTILYTDYFLNETIEFLKHYDDRFETAMLYVSDHGESLGEHGLYLHGMPYALAPRDQTHVPVILWMGRQHDDYDLSQVLKVKEDDFSHDYIFHTLLGLFEIETNDYDPSLSLVELGMHQDEAQ